MSACDFCSEESKFIFVCPHCENRYCKNHRRPDDHNCISLEKKQVNNISFTNTDNVETVSIKNENIYQIQSEEKNDNFIEIETASDHNQVKIDEQKRESNTINIFSFFNSNRKISIVMLIIVSLISGLITGTLINPNDYDKNLQQRYDALYEYYLETQARNIELTEELNNMTIELSLIQEQLIQINIQYEIIQAQMSRLQENYDQLLADYNALQSK
jgi:hypothetical protein